MDDIRKWLDNPNWPEFGPGIGHGPLDPGRVAARAAVEQVLDHLAPSPDAPGLPNIECLCGDVFTTTEDMALHLWMAHGHEVPPPPESVRAASERLGIPLSRGDLPMDVVRPSPFAEDWNDPAMDVYDGETPVRMIPEGK